MTATMGGSSVRRGAIGSRAHRGACMLAAVGQASLLQGVCLTSGAHYGYTMLLLLRPHEPQRGKAAWCRTKCR